MSTSQNHSPDLGLLAEERQSMFTITESSEVFLFNRYSLQKKTSQNSTKEIKEEVLTEVQVKSFRHQVKTMAET